MAKMTEYTIEVQKELKRLTKVQARDFYEAVRIAGIVVKRGDGKIGRPRKD